MTRRNDQMTLYSAFDHPPIDSSPRTHARRDHPETSHQAAEQVERQISPQCESILDLLRTGPATRTELQSICCTPTARISDLRRSGYDIRCEIRTGLPNLYVLDEGDNTCH